MNSTTVIPTISPWIPIIISLTSLVVALLNTYATTFKKSKPSVLIGSQISIYSAPYQMSDGPVWGATGIYIPVTFFNWSPNGGSIIDCRINLWRIENPDEIFDIDWYEFHEMKKDSRAMGNVGFAQPIPISPKGSLTKTILFVWLPNEQKRLKMIPGKYSLVMLVWTKESLKPSFKQKFEFYVSQNQSEDFNLNLKNENSLTIDVSIRETNRRNNILTRNQAEDIYY